MNLKIIYQDGGKEELEIGTGRDCVCVLKCFLCGVLACDLFNQHTLHRFGAAWAGCICCGTWERMRVWEDYFE